MRKRSVACFTSAAIVSVLLVGCATADMLVSPSDPYGPEGTRIGIVRYAVGGRHTDARRQTAAKKMYDACHGHYKIISEGPRDFQVHGAYAIPNPYNHTYVMAAKGGVAEFMYIRFECVTP